jgi:hypothetical protein
MGYLKNTINVQHALKPLITQGYGTNTVPIVDQTTKSVEFTISGVVSAEKKIECAPTVGTDTLGQAGLKPGMVIRNANGFGRQIETVADDYIIVNASGNFFGGQKFFAYAAKTDGVLIYVGATNGSLPASLTVETAGGEVVEIHFPPVSVVGPFITPVQCVRVIALNEISSDKLLYLF